MGKSAPPIPGLFLPNTRPGSPGQPPPFSALRVHTSYVNIVHHLFPCDRLYPCGFDRGVGTPYFTHWISKYPISYLLVSAEPCRPGLVGAGAGAGIGAATPSSNEREPIPSLWGRNRRVSQGSSVEKAGVTSQCRRRQCNSDSCIRAKHCCFLCCCCCCTPREPHPTATTEDKSSRCWWVGLRRLVHGIPSHATRLLVR